MKKIICEDCGPDAVFHKGQKIGIYFDWIMRPVTIPLRAITRLFSPVVAQLPWEYAMGNFLHFLSRMKIGSIGDAHDDKDSLRTKVLWESANNRGIQLEEFRLFMEPNANTFIAHKDGEWRIFEGLPRTEKRDSDGLWWMDNKAIMKKKFLKAGIPVAKGGAYFSLSAAAKTLEQLSPPVIAKPHVGSRSRHTTIHINNTEELTLAFKKAKQLSPLVIIEEELEGDVYRGTIIGGKVAGIIRREAPNIVGDGVRTVRALVDEENKNPKRQGPIFHEISINDESSAELARQGFSWESIPHKGERVTLHPKVSRSFGAATRDVTDITHPDNNEMLLAVARLLNDSLVGIDFIIKDITRSWKEQNRSGVIECNSCPFIDLHHYPLFGEPRDAAGMLWDLVYPESM